MPFANSSLNRPPYLAVDDGPSRMMTPVDGSGTPAPPASLLPEAVDPEEEQRRAHFANLFRSAESKISQIFGSDGRYDLGLITSLARRAPSPPPTTSSHSQLPPPATDHAPITEPPRKRAKRAINEDDYDDDDDDDDNGNGPSHPTTISSPQNAKSTALSSGPGALPSPSKSGSSPVQSVTSPSRQVEKHRDLVVLLAPSSDPSQSSSSLATTTTSATQLSTTMCATQQKSSSSEDARKQLEAARTATEEAARRSFHTIFYTLENDRTAMLEQQQLEESEKQLQAEMDSHQSGPAVSNAQAQNLGTLSSTNLGASSLTLKHLIARIDMKRDVVNATDSELRLLMNEVRKNRSKWASEENINQEELYEALEKVLTELKAHTEYSTPFLTRVNKREAPDYYNIIKQPMDLGTMTKKLKGLVFKSKADFVGDLNLIWDNCLKYNRDMSHPLRRMANGMRKEAEKLIPLIPDLTVRSRAEVEAEERRKQNGGDEDNGEDSEDEPIMSSRGRAGGTTSTKGTSKARRSGDVEKEGTPAEQKPHIQVNGVLAKAREGSEADGSVRGTPPIAGSQTPIVAPQGDSMDVDGPSLSGLALTHTMGETTQAVYEDEEYKIWKQVTKKGRALITRERYMLFKESSLNPDAPALLRRKADMRRFLRNQKMIDCNASSVRPADAGASSEEPVNTETLVDNMDNAEEEERVVPAYYQPQSLIPDIPPHLQWIEDGEGQVVNQNQWAVKVIEPSVWKSPASKFSQQIDANIRQIQETRKLSTKISVVKQMQVQTQVYSNQFPKAAEPFVEADVPPQFVTDDGPLIAGNLCEKALQRSIGKILYHAGFEELQPSAVDALTDIAADYFQKLCRTFNVYNEADKMQVTLPDGPTMYKPRYTQEEIILHTLDENGYDIATLEAYVTDDTVRLGGKLSQIHERMKQHLTDILRPALTAEAGVDGVGAFNDGSEQFVSGDFAEDLGEDFFGFRELGLDKDLGLDMLSVPLHLLQSRMRSQYQQTQPTGTTDMDILPPYPPHTPVARESLNEEIGLVRNFFLAKLHATNGEPLVEDEDLPIKQRRPRPRLPATGKISAPQKKPLREQIALAKKKKKMEAAAAASAAAAAAGPSSSSGSGSQENSAAKPTGDTTTKAPSRPSVGISMKAGLPAGTPDQGLKPSQMSIAVGGDME
ncbi:Transcriptional activator spt7 [Ceratocystis pirilliformis]|uniref:Transcriptional activator spt7 n=1 Tax=Ceratocystis pirilliformis TaxID=259994 RepID=A0ABR3YQH1_9PEZI